MAANIFLIAIDAHLVVVREKAPVFVQKHNLKRESRNDLTFQSC